MLLSKETEQDQGVGKTLEPVPSFVSKSESQSAADFEQV